MSTWEERGGKVVLDLMRDVDLAMEPAAGLVGNLGYETLGFTKMQEMKPLVPGSRGGLNLAQWTGPRRRKLEAWSAENGLDDHSMEAGYGFLLHELRGEYKWFLDRLRGTQKVDVACHLTHRLYERPQDVLDRSYRSSADRLRYAQEALRGAIALSAASTPGAPEGLGLDHVALAKSLQRALKRHGLYTGKVDGIWGRGSRAAYAEFLRQC